MASFASMQDAKAKIKAAEEVDPSIFDYDSFHDTKASVTNAKKAAAQKDAIERKPKYKNQFFEAAAKRKQDQQISRDKLLQRNREAEGEEFADKEKFVTGAYKKQQEENRLAEEEERQKNDADEQRRRRLGGSGMQGFYRNIIDQRERQYRDDVAATNEKRERGENRSSNPDGDEQQKEKSDAELAAEAQARGVNVHLNDEGQITDKRQLLSAGLNVGAPKSRNDPSRGTSAAEHLRMSNSQRQPGLGGGRAGVDQRQAQRERQTRMLEEQLAAQNKRAREEEEEEKARLERAAKSTKTDKDIGDARARYLARKAAKERGEG